MTKTLTLLAAALVAAGCTTMAPDLPQAQSGTPVVVAAPGLPASGVATVAETPWQRVFTDPALQKVIEMALADNRDLRTTVLQVEQARAQYGIQRANQWPSLGAQLTGTRNGTDSTVTQQYSAGLAVSAFELDLFGRVRSLSDAALHSWLSTDEARASAQISLVAEVANAYLTLAADRSRLTLARATLESYTQSLNLAERRHTAGAISGLDLAQSRTQAASARADVASYERAVANDRLALDLLAGGPVADDLLPQGLTPRVAALPAPPAGLPSEVLLRRPDVKAAEHDLRAANARIGAARAAFFPSISLTGSVGSASNELSGLFKSGTGVWSFVPQITLPIFQGGALTASLESSEAAQGAALAQYEKAIQSAFKDVAGALASTSWLAVQREAQVALVESSVRADTLADARWKAGRDSQLTRLDTQRTRYAAEQALIATELAEQSARVGLYRALGGGWIQPG